MLTQIRLLLMEQSGLSLNCLTKMHLNISADDKAVTRRVKGYNPCRVDYDFHFLAQDTNSEELINGHRNSVNQNFVIQRLNTEYNV